MAGEWGRFQALYLLTLRRLLTSRRALVTAVIAALPLAVAGALTLGGVREFDALLLQAFAIPLEFQVVVIFVALVHAIALVREEVEDETIVYPLLRPVGRPALLAYRYLALVTATLALLLPPLALAYAVAQGNAGQALGADLDVLGGLLLATALAGPAYGALFLLLSLLVRRPLLAGLLYGFVWESIVGGLPGDVPRLSVVHYARSVLKGTIAVGPLSTYATDLGPGPAGAVLGAIAAGALLLAALVFQGMEFKQRP